MRTKLTTGLLIAAAAIAPLIGAAGTAAADDGTVTGWLPANQCQAEAARLNASSQPAPDQTTASGKTYYCYQSDLMDGYGVVKVRLWSI